MGLSKNSPVRLGVSPAAASTPTGVFNQRCEALFPRAGALGCSVSLTPTMFLPVYLCANVGPWSHRLPSSSHNPPCLWVQPHCCESSPRWLPVSSTPPTGLDEFFFFISLVVGLLWGSLFCQFWLFFVFKLLLSFFWLCKEAAVCLPMPPSWPELSIGPFFSNKILV